MSKLLLPLMELQQRQRKNKEKVYKPRMVFTLGNHEQRIERYVNDNPELSEFLSYKNLGLERFGWEVHDFLKPVDVDGIIYTHYLANPMTGRPYSGTALSQLKTVGKSYVVGHKQVLDIGIRPVLDGSMQLGIICGACLTPDHKVLHSDLTYRPLGELKEGDTLVSFDEEPDGVRRGRRYKKGTVLAVKRDVKEVFSVELSSGKTFKVTNDHKWITKLGTKYIWRETRNLRIGTVIPRLLEEWDTIDSYDAGWLSGMYDGEGCYYIRKTKAGQVAQLSIYQKEGDVADKIEMLISKVLGENLIMTKGKRNSVISWRVQGGIRGISKVLGALRPIRLIKKFEPDHLGQVISSPSDEDKVIKITPIGEMEIVQTKIDCGTMIVEGYGHHNCYPHDEDYKGHQGNNHFRGVIVLHDVRNGFADPMLVSLDYLNRRYG